MIMMENSRLAKNWAMGCHLAALALYVGIPFGNLIGPLLIWLLKRDEYPLVDEQGKESLNFQISVLIYSVVATVLIVIFAVTFILIPLAVIMGILLALLFIANLILVIVAAVKVSDGQSFQYPFSLRLIK